MRRLQITLFILLTIGSFSYLHGTEVEMLHDSIEVLQQQLAQSKVLQLESSTFNSKLIYCLALSFSFICALFYIAYDNVKLAKKYSQWASKQYKSYSAHQKIVSKINPNSELKSILEHQIKVMRELITSYNENSGNIKIFIRHFKEKISINTPHESFWSDLRIFTDANNNNIITRMKQEFPQLSDKDINFIILTCCDFSYIEIAICLGYANANSISNCRTAIARKIGINEPLFSYLKNRINQDHENI